MNQTDDMAVAIVELRNAAAAITNVADWLAETFNGAKENEPPPSETPETKPTLTLTDVRAVLAEKARSGHSAKIRALLESFGAEKLSDIDPSLYDALLMEAGKIT